MDLNSVENKIIELIKPDSGFMRCIFRNDILQKRLLNNNFVKFTLIPINYQLDKIQSLWPS